MLEQMSECDVGTSMEMLKQKSEEDVGTNKEMLKRLSKEDAGKNELGSCWNKQGDIEINAHGHGLYI